MPGKIKFNGIEIGKVVDGGVMYTQPWPTFDVAEVKPLDPEGYVTPAERSVKIATSQIHSLMDLPATQEDSYSEWMDYAGCCHGETHCLFCLNWCPTCKREWILSLESTAVDFIKEL